MLLFVAAMFFWSGFDQSGGSLSIFARDYTDLTVFGYPIPVGWLQFANPLFVVIFAPIFAGIWTNLARMNLNPSYPLKFAIGMFFMAISFVIMIAAVELALVSAPVGMQWLIITYLILGVNWPYLLLDWQHFLNTLQKNIKDRCLGSGS